MKSLHLLAAALPLWMLMPGLNADADEPSYLDDRSNPEALVRSLYNAINRQEYARAYAYFASPPAKTLETYAQGYADTEHVEVVTGLATEEGAAGSIYYSIPVAISARDTNGEEQVFAGCYDLRLVNPLVQTTPFTPLHIESGRLAAADAPLEEALPASCGDGPAPQGDLLMEKAKKTFTAVYGDICRAEEYPDEKPESHVIRYSDANEPEGSPESEARLFRFFCDLGAYNEVHAYLMTNSLDELRPVQFAVPELDIRYEKDDSEGRVEEVRIIGYRTEELLVNSWFDPQERSISSHAKWRGVGDMSSSGHWIFRDGAFSLVRYDVDASYDGEINPETVLDYSTGP